MTPEDAAPFIGLALLLLLIIATVDITCWFNLPTDKD